MRAPRVTLGIATYERDTYLAEAIASCLNQDFDDFEVLVVLDGGRNPRIEEIVAGFDDARLRVVRHEVNRGIAEAYNTIVREGRGELVGILGADDVSEPHRLARSVALFDRHPDTGIADVERALRETSARLPLRALVPELDWGAVHPRRAERRAWEVLADALERRELPLPGLAAELRERAVAVPAPPKPMPNGKRILLTSFGFEDSGGGTTVPRVVAKELVNRGWDVTVFHAATKPHPSGEPYAVSETEVDGVRLIGVH